MVCNKNSSFKLKRLEGVFDIHMDRSKPSPPIRRVFRSYDNFRSSMGIVKYQIANDGLDKKGRDH